MAEERHVNSSDVCDERSYKKGSMSFPEMNRDTPSLMTDDSRICITEPRINGRIICSISGYTPALKARRFSESRHVLCWDAGRRAAEREYSRGIALRS